MFIFVLAGCHHVAEYGSGNQSRVTVIGTSDHQVRGSIEGIANGRLMVSDAEGRPVVISSDGILYRIDPYAMTVDTSYSIGGSSGTGYSNAVTAFGGHLYVAGPGSQLIEVDLSSNTVVDQFVPCSKPGALAASPVEGRLYFIDDLEQCAGEIYTNNNVNGFTSTLPSPCNDLIVEPGSGKYVVLIGYGGGLYVIWLDFAHNVRPTNHSVGSGSSCITSMSEDSLYAVCCPAWNSDEGYVVLVQGYGFPDVMKPRYYVEGHPVQMSWNRLSGFNGNLSVVSKTGSGDTHVTVFGFHLSPLEPVIVWELEISGYPRDIIAPGDGSYIAVLTSD